MFPAQAGNGPPSMCGSGTPMGVDAGGRTWRHQGGGCLQTSRIRVSRPPALPVSEKGTHPWT